MADPHKILDGRLLDLGDGVLLARSKYSGWGVAPGCGLTLEGWTVFRDGISRRVGLVYAHVALVHGGRPRGRRNRRVADGPEGSGVPRRAAGGQS